MPNAPEIQITLCEDAAAFDQFAGWLAASDPWLTLRLDTAYCRKAFEGHSRECWTISVNGSTAGFVILQMAGTFRGYIQTLFIAPEFQGKGLGHQLLDFCEAHIGRTSPNIFICVSSFNEGARRLYESRGFEQIGVLKDFIRSGYDELLYRKSIGPFVP